MGNASLQPSEQLSITCRVRALSAHQSSAALVGTLWRNRPEVQREEGVYFTESAQAALEAGKPHGLLQARRRPGHPSGDGCLSFPLLHC